MKTVVLGLLLPVILILHNAEEYWSFEEFKKTHLRFIKEKFRQRKIFLYALVILTTCASGICISNYFVGGRTFQFVTTIIVLSLFLNGIQHCISSLWARKILPGTISAAFLLIPYPIFYLVSLENEIRFGIFDIMRWSLLAVIFMISSIYISFRIGYLFHSYSKR